MRSRGALGTALYMVKNTQYIKLYSSIYTTDIQNRLGLVSGSSPITTCSVKGYKSGPGQLTLYYLYGSNQAWDRPTLNPYHAKFASTNGAISFCPNGVQKSTPLTQCCKNVNQPSPSNVYSTRGYLWQS